jgi:hypothetical protein
MAEERIVGWYWVRKAGWGGTYGDWTPALWKPEFRSWSSVGFSGIPDSEMIVGDRMQPPSAEPQRDADRYHWLRARLMGADFNWNETGTSALVFEMPKEARISASCDKTIDEAMALTMLTPN